MWLSDMLTFFDMWAGTSTDLNISSIQYPIQIKRRSQMSGGSVTTCYGNEQGSIQAECHLLPDMEAQQDTRESRFFWVNSGWCAMQILQSLSFRTVGLTVVDKQRQPINFWLN